MKISDLQRQIKFNAETIYELETEILVNKRDMGHTWIAYGSYCNCKWTIKVLKSKIKRLADLQKALKKEIAYQISEEAVERVIARIHEGE